MNRTVIEAAKTYETTSYLSDDGERERWDAALKELKAGLEHDNSLRDLSQLEDKARKRFSELYSRFPEELTQAYREMCEDLILKRRAEAEELMQKAGKTLEDGKAFKRGADILTLRAIDPDGRVEPVDDLEAEFARIFSNGQLGVGIWERTAHIECALLGPDEKANNDKASKLAEIRADLIARKWDL